MILPLTTVSLLCPFCSGPQLCLALQSHRGIRITMLLRLAFPWRSGTLSLVCKSLVALLPLPLALLLLEASLPFLLRPPLNHFIATNKTTSCKQASLLSQHLPLLACRPSLICRYLSLLLLFLLLIRLHATFLVWHT